MCFNGHTILVAHFPEPNTFKLYMVLRAGEAARMDQDDFKRPKWISNPPRWHQDYLLTQSRTPACTQGQTISDHVLLEVSQGAAISEIRAEVRELAGDVQQIKEMLSELSQRMRTMQIRMLMLKNGMFTLSPSPQRIFLE